VFLPLEIIEKHGLSPLDLNDKSKDENIKRLVSELLELAVIHLDDAVEYISSVPEKLNDVRMFLIVPVLLAIETLNLISDKPVQTMTGPAVKLTRRDVVILTSKAVICSKSDPHLRKYYGKLRDKRR
jgi:farnesyl-diphosphate farnesyltransferase